MNNEKRATRIVNLQNRLGYSFRDENLLLEALTHPSCNTARSDKNYERLEFLGDAVLNLIIAEILYNKYKKVFENKLSMMRAKFVSSDAICFVASNINLADELILSSGEDKNGGRQNYRNIENTMEAIIGAIYLDSNIEITKQTIKKLWQPLIEHQEILGIDSKTYLQEWAQKNKLKIPLYNVISSDGPSHAPYFIMEVEIENYKSVQGEGNNKKEAEKAAASAFIKKYIDVDGA